MVVTPSATTAQRLAAPRTLLRNALLVDGTGAAPKLSDVVIDGGHIVAIEPAGSIPLEAAAVLEDLAGLVLAPGFIDIHNHSTTRLRNDPLATTQVAQGVTTVLVGADGNSPWPIAAYLAEIDALHPTVNVGVMVGHGTIRRQVLGNDFRRPATREEITSMAAAVQRGMTDGAFGLSSGLEYDPGFYSNTEELIELARIAAQRGGFYMSHMRDEEEGVVGAINEAIRIGADAGIGVQISHIKMGNASVWGKASVALELIQQARRRGIDVTADQYPYTAWQSGLGIIVRSRRYSDPTEVALGLQAAGGAERLQITNYGHDPSVNGMRLNAIASRDGKTAVQMYSEMMRNGGAEIIGHTMSEDDVTAFMASPLVMTASDGGIGSTHPRGAGAFARVLGHYTRDLGVLTLERAVQRGTSLPAAKMGLLDRGVIRVGARADLVAFDPTTVADRSTFSQPLIAAIGVEKTWVSGILVWDAGTTTGARPGAALRPTR